MRIRMNGSATAGGLERRRLNLLVVASSFPSVNQPWISTYLKQLRARGFDFTLVSFRPPATEAERRAGGDALADCLFLPGDSRDLLACALRLLAQRPFDGGVLLLRFARQASALQVGLKARLKVTLFSLVLHRSLAGRGPFDLIHVYFDQDTVLVLPYAARAGLPVVATFHGLNPVGVPRMAAAHRRATYRGVRALLVNTRFAREQVTSLGCEGARVRIIPQGLEVDEFSFHPAPPPPSGEPIEILTVGRLQRDKGQAYAVLAACRLLREGHRLKWRFVGSGPDRERLRGLVERLQLGESVTFHGSVSTGELRALYARSHVFVLPSVSNARGYHVETQGVVLQEAQATGCVVVATRVGGIPECVTDGVDGILVRERSSRALSEAIRGLAADPSGWAAMRQAGRRNVEGRFSTADVGRRLDEFYRGILHSRAAIPARVSA
jgi:colanic acid/amylovoran biosynthesis glycosyltransferase